jgi:protocatechuate 3,4-dioxygenase beta subunit
VKMKGREKWTTQCYIKAESARNEKDGVYKGITDLKQQAAVTVDFSPVKGSRIGELAAKFDIIMGFTPQV